MNLIKVAKEMEKISKVLKSYDYKYDPTHKNKPKGNWARTDRGWSLSVAKTDSIQDFTEKEREELRNLREDFKNEWTIKDRHSDSWGVMNDTIDACIYDREHTKGMFFKGEKGLLGGLSFFVERNKIQLYSLFSKPGTKGAGSFMLASFIKKVIEPSGKKLTLDALEEAIPFYLKIGMKQVGKLNSIKGFETRFEFSHQDSVKFANRFFSELNKKSKKASNNCLLDLIKLEPQNGVLITNKRR